MSQQHSPDTRLETDGPDTQALALSDEDWEQYLDKLHETTPENRRVNTRHQKIIQCLMRVATEGRNQVFVIHSRDLSDGGMSFQHRSPLTDETECTMVLETNIGQSHVVTAQVAWSRQVSDEVYTIGLRFTQPLNLAPFMEADAA